MTAARRSRAMPAVALVLALSMWMAVANSMTAGVEASEAQGYASAASQTISLQTQEDGEQGAAESAQRDGAPEPDDRVDVQVWTVAAAGIAMALGLIGLLVRILMGWVKPAPAPEESHH